MNPHCDNVDEYCGPAECKDKCPDPGSKEYKEKCPVREKAPLDNRRRRMDSSRLRMLGKTKHAHLKCESEHPETCCKSAECKKCECDGDVECQHLTTKYVGRFDGAHLIALAHLLVWSQMVRIFLLS